MITVYDDRLVIVIKDNAPAERITWIVKAIAAHLRHYSQNPNKRKDDSEHAEVLCDFMGELAEIENATQQKTDL